MSELPSKRLPRQEQLVYVGQGEVAISRWHPSDARDMDTLSDIMHRRKVTQNVDFSGTTPYAFGREFDTGKLNKNEYNFAIRYGLKHPSGVGGKPDAYVYFHFDEDDAAEYDRIASYGVLPPRDPQRQIFEVGYARSPRAPSHFTNRGVMGACQVMNLMLGRHGEAFLDQKPNNEAFHDTEPDKLPKYTMEELSRMTPAERILKDAPVDMIIYEWVSEMVRREPIGNSGKTRKRIYRNEEGERLLKSAGFVEVGTVPDDELPGGNMHIYLLDWRQLQGKMHERADEWILQAIGRPSSVK